MKDTTYALLKQHLKKEDGKPYKKREIITEFKDFKETFYGAFPVDETTIAQHLLQKKGIKLEFPEYRVRGTFFKIRNMEKGKRAFTGELFSPTIIVAIGAKMAEPKVYRGCPHDNCYAEVKDGNCSKERGGHGFVGEKDLPEYTMHFLKISDGESERDSSVVTVRHDVNNGETIEGVWKLKGMVTDGGFYAWAGMPINPEDLEDWDEAEDDEMKVISPDGGDDDGVPDLSYLDDEVESTSDDKDNIESEEGLPDDWKKLSDESTDEESTLPEELVTHFLNIVKNEGQIEKEKVMYWLVTKELDAPTVLVELLKTNTDKVKEEGGKILWLLPQND